MTHCRTFNIRLVYSHSKYVKLNLSFEWWATRPSEARGCVESKCLCCIHPTQEFVIPWSRCWVSCKAGTEEVWWIKLLSSLTHYMFPLDTFAGWITIGLEEAAGGKEWEEERVRRRDLSIVCLDWPFVYIQMDVCGFLMLGTVFTCVGFKAD